MPFRLICMVAWSILAWSSSWAVNVLDEEESAAASRAKSSSEAATSGLVLVGRLPEGAIRSLFIPPTRPDNACAATDRRVYNFNSKNSRWVSIYETKPGDSGILGIAGYAKSSKPLYVVHGCGVAISHDGGSSWEESVPSGYLADETLIALAVNPTDRRQAVFATGKGAWITRNYGKTWAAFDLPNPAEPLIGLAYAGSQKPVLVAATRQALYVSDEKGQSWTALQRRLNGPVALAPPGPTSLAVSFDSSKNLTVFDLKRPGFWLSRPVDISPPPIALALDSKGSGGVWLQTPHEILFVNLQEKETPLRKVHTTAQEIYNLISHPHKMDSIYWSEGPSLYRLDGVFSDSDGLIEENIPAEDFEKIGTVEVKETGKADTAALVKQAQAILDEMMAASPPLEEVVQAALHFASFKPGEAEQWKKDVRRKNLLPELWLSAGEQEYPVDKYNLITNQDRYGVPSTSDIHEDDDVRYMNKYAIELRWKFDALIFNLDQLKVSEEARKGAEQRNSLITQVTELYYRRLELLVQKQVNADRMNLEEIISLRIRLEQITKLLNGLCGKPLFESKF